MLLLVLMQNARMSDERPVKAVFISYRTEDTADVASSVYRELKRRLGPESVFIDHRDLAPGTPWPDELHRQVERASVVLVLIGRNWLTARDVYGSRRLDDPEDWVRREIEAAMNSKRTVVPLMVDDAPAIPKEAFRRVPSLAAFADLEHCRLRRKDWESDFETLLTLLTEHGVQATMGELRAEPIAGGVLAETDRLLEVYVHRAFFSGAPDECHFINLTNLSPNRVVEVTHVWYEDEEHHIPVLQASRPLPVRLELDQSWQTWIQSSRLPISHRHDALSRFRARLSTGSVFISRANPSVPPIGMVPGGPIF